MLISRIDLLSIVLFSIIVVSIIENVNCDLLSNVFRVKHALSLALGKASHKTGKLPLMAILTGSLINKTPNGLTISEGDIVLDLENRKGVSIDGELWPNGLVPYIFHDSVVKGQRDIIIEAMHHWEENTCLRFVNRSTTDLHFIRFRSDTSGCWSSVGRKFMKIGVGQDISLGIGCSKVGFLSNYIDFGKLLLFFAVVHEIGHSLGYYHEHARSDRDKFVKILWDNVKSGMNVQFEIKNTRNENVEYDYRSIMHYPAWAFSKSPLSKNVIVSKNPFFQYLIDEEKDSLSFREKCVNFRKTKCINQGYLSPFKEDGKYCFCMCPPGFYGELCEFSVSKDNAYYGKHKCGGNITIEGPISTPNYPIRKQEYESCGFWIRAPINHIVEVTFEDFSFCEPYDGNEKEGIQGKCLFESVEIRNSADIYNGDIYCGEQIESGTVMKSDKRDFIILITADDQMKGRGLKADVKFVEETADQLENQNVGEIIASEPQNIQISESQNQNEALELIPSIL